MTQVRIDLISGGTFPISVYIADVYGNNQSLLGVIGSGPVPPVVKYNSTIPAIFNTAPQIMLKLIDSNNCEMFKILDCTFGCAFEITVQVSSCTVDITITPITTLTPTPTNTTTPVNETPTPTPTNTVTPTNTPTSETPTPTPTVTETPTNTPTITPTNTETPTNTPTNTETPTNTPTITPTNTETPTNTPTNTQTPTNTGTPGASPSQTPTNTETPTNTPTNTGTPGASPSQTPTLTQTPTPTSQGFMAYIFAEPQTSGDDTTLLTWAGSNGAIDWGDYYSGTVPNNAGGNYDNDLNVYAHQPSFISGGGNFVTPITLSAPILQSAGTYSGCSLSQYAFGAIPVIPTTNVNPNIEYFYSIWLPLAGIGGSVTNYTIDVGTTLCGQEIENGIPVVASTTLSYDVTVTSGAAIPAGTYRVIWVSPNLLLPISTPLTQTYYFMGDTKS